MDLEWFNELNEWFPNRDQSFVTLWGASWSDYSGAGWIVILEREGQLYTLVDMGESAMGMYPPQAQLDSPLRGLVSPGWCSEVGYVLGAGGGQHLVTRSEKERDAFAK